MIFLLIYFENSNTNLKNISLVNDSNVFTNSICQVVIFQYFFSKFVKFLHYFSHYSNYSIIFIMGTDYSHYWVH